MPDPRLLATGRARLKVLSVAAENPGALVIGADQVLEFEGQALGKLGDSGAALKRLQTMAGTTHFLHSAWSLAYLPRRTSEKPNAEKTKSAKTSIVSLTGEPSPPTLPAARNQVGAANFETIKDILVEDHLTTVSMTMRDLVPEELHSYLERDEWQGSVGCYKFEEVGRNLFQSHSVDETAIIGLPMDDILKRLRVLGINPLLQPTPPWSISGLGT